MRILPQDLAPLAAPGYRRLWLGQTAGWVGDGILPISLAIAVLGAGEGAISIGALLGSRAFALFIGFSVGGGLIDRYSRRAMLVGAAAVKAGSVVVIVAVLPTGSVLAICACMFLFGIGEALFRPTSRAIIPRLVTAALLQRANALSGLSNRSTAIAAPALGGVLSATLGGRVSLMTGAVAFMISLSFLVVIGNASERSANVSRQPWWNSVLDGFAAVSRRRWIAFPVLGGAVQIAFSVAPWLVLLPVIATEHYGPAIYGACVSIYAGGGVVGALIGGRANVKAPGVIAILSASTFALVMAGLILMPPAWVLLLLHFIAGAGLQVFGVLWDTAVQREVPDELLGRVLSFSMVPSSLLMPIALPMAGLVSSSVGHEPVLLAGLIATISFTIPLLAVRDVRVLSDRLTQKSTSAASERVVP